jgi:EAL domain-containing protein (putative c-di-GMP-specific phosphodiesterase class I)
MALHELFPARRLEGAMRWLAWVAAPALAFLLACVMLAVALAQGELRQEAHRRVEILDADLDQLGAAGTPARAVSGRISLPSDPMRLSVFADGATSAAASGELLLSTLARSLRHGHVVQAGFDAHGLWERSRPAMPLAGAGALACALLGLVALRQRRSPDDDIREGLSRALARGEFEGHLQPIMELASGRCVGAEMLMRWRHPTEGLVGPASFLPLARATGLITEMTEACFRQVADQLDACEHLGDGFMLSVNFTGAQLVRESDCERFTALARPGGRRWYTVIEVSETDARDAAVPPRLARLQDAGFLIALDDFGTAYGGTRWLERLPVDLVKIDNRIVATIGTDSVMRPVLDAIVLASRQTGVHLIAEAVETRAQAAHLRQLGVSCAQGFAYSAAMSAEDFTQRWLPELIREEEGPRTLSGAGRHPVDA